MKQRYWLTITEEMVKNPRSLGKGYFPLIQCMGRLMPRDIGKKAYVWDDGTVQAENDEQLAIRMTATL